MKLFRISLPSLNLCILDDLIPNNVLDTNSPTFFQNTGFIGIESDLPHAWCLHPSRWVIDQRDRNVRGLSHP